MMQLGEKRQQHLRGTLVLLLSFILTACVQSTTTFIPSDPPPADPVINTASAIDNFYGHMLKVRSKHRTFENFQDDYVEIETLIRSLIFRARIGQYNEAAQNTLDEVLDKWLKYRNLHKEHDTYKTQLARTNRARFTRLLSEVVVGRESLGPTWLE